MKIKATKAAYNKYTTNNNYFEKEPILIKEYLNKYSGNSIITRFRRWWNDISEELNDEDNKYLKIHSKNVNKRRNNYKTRKNQNKINRDLVDVMNIYWPKKP